MASCALACSRLAVCNIDHHVKASYTHRLKTMKLIGACIFRSAGNLTGLISQPGTIAFSFYFFERFRYLGNRFLPGADQLIAFLAGGLAQSAAVVVMYPVRAAKDKLQGQREGTYAGLGDVLRKSCGCL